MRRRDDVKSGERWSARLTRRAKVIETWGKWISGEGAAARTRNINEKPIEEMLKVDPASQAQYEKIDSPDQERQAKTLGQRRFK